MIHKSEVMDEKTAQFDYKKIIKNLPSKNLHKQSKRKTLEKWG